MRDYKLLVAVVLVAICATSVQGNFFTDLTAKGQEFFEGASEKTKTFFKNSYEKLNEVREKMMNKLKNLTDDVKALILNDDFSTTDVTMMLDKVPKNGWFFINTNALVSTMPADNFTLLMENGKGVIPPPILKKLQMAKDADVTTEVAITKLQATNNNGKKIPQPLMMAYVRKLGDPTKLTAENITIFGATMVERLPPPFLKKITDKDALKKVNEFLQQCVSNEQCPKKMTMKAIMMDNYKKIYGSISTWTLDNVTQIGSSKLSPMILKKLPANTLKGIKAQLVNRQYSLEDGPMPQKVVLSALVKAEEVQSKTPEQIVQWLSTLGGLKEYVDASMIPPAARENADVKAILENNINALANSGRLDSKASQMALMNRLKGKFANNITSAEVKKMAGLLQFVNPGLLRQITKRNILSQTELAKLAAQLPNGAPGSEAKGRTIAAALRADGGVSAIPDSMTKFLSLQDVRGLSSVNAESRLTNCKMQNCDINDRSAKLMVDKVPDGNKPNLPAKYKCLIPVTDYANQNLGTLTNYAKETSFTSAMCLQAAQKAFGDKKNITAAYIKTNLNLVSCMGPSHAAEVALDEISAALKNINDGKIPLSPDACRELTMKWLNRTMTEREVEDKEELAATLTYDDVIDIPPCVLATLGGEAYEAIDASLKESILTLMGEYTNNDAISTRMKRRIIDEGLYSMEDSLDTISPDTLDKLKSASMDLSADNLKKFDWDAKVLYLTLLEQMYKFGTPPCLNGDQKEAIAMMMEDVFGPVSTWEDLSQRGCSIELLPKSKIGMISEYVIGTAVCQMEESCKEDYMEGREVLCKAEVGEDEIERDEENREEIEERQVEATLATANELNAKKRRKREATSTSCDKVDIAGAEVLNENEINSMTNDSFLLCLAAFGQDEMDSSKARVLWNKLKNAKNNDISTLTASEMTDMGCIWKGIQTSEVKNLPTLTYNTMDGVVNTMGKECGLSEAQLVALGDKVLKDWKPSNTMSDADLTNLNVVICGFNTSTIEAISSSAIKRAMPILSKLDCSDKVKRDLAAKAVVAYGDVLQWTAANVKEMWSLIGHMLPELVRKIPGNAICGLAIAGCESLPPDTIAAMTLHQIGNLTIKCYFAFNKDQQGAFTEDMNVILLKTAFPFLKGGVASMTASIALVVTTIAALLALV